MECNKDRNMNYCNCTFSCGKKGTCCDCLHYHRKMGQLPGCYFPSDYERTGDRDIESFINLYHKQGAWW